MYVILYRKAGSLISVITNHSFIGEWTENLSHFRCMIQMMNLKTRDEAKLLYLILLFSLSVLGLLETLVPVLAILSAMIERIVVERIVQRSFVEREAYNSERETTSWPPVTEPA